MRISGYNLVWFMVHVKQEPITVFAKSAPSPSQTSTVVASSSKADDCLEGPVVPPPPKQNPTVSKIVGAEACPSQQTTLSTHVAKDDVLKAEILWAIKCLTSHFSCNSSNNTNKLFQAVFPDSGIAQQFGCGKTKCSYLIKYGLAPFLHQKVVDTLQKPGCLFTVCVDESFNRAVQEEQRDKLLHFWDDERKQVISRYFDSKFLGHTRANDLLDNFLKSLDSLNQANLLQISMDGPTTNWKLLTTSCITIQSRILIYLSC